MRPELVGAADTPGYAVNVRIAGEHAYGIVGALLAVPTASIIQSAFIFFVLDRQGEAA